MPGDADHVSTFRFTVHRRVVKGLTFEKAQAGYMDSELEASLLLTIRELEALDNIVGIRFAVKNQKTILPNPFFIRVTHFAAATVAF